ncbi:MAG: 12,18-didecarboxysiroheme deacetylase [Anaerolinea sp.]|nr:12,18-didecarboxysiroheme deacetylase [Anaerolinea sp.]
MLSVSRLLNGSLSEGDVLRYGRSSQRGPAHLLHFSADKKPVVAWNITGQCNLKCMHCYASATSKPFAGELTTAECYKVLDDLAAYKVPSVLFSGGEPLMRPELFEFADYARQLGLRTVLSTNGTLIDSAMALRIREAGFTYAGISLDGTEPTHDRIRGKRGAFAASLEAIRRLREAGVRTGLRFTVHAKNLQDLPAVFDLVEEEEIPRICVYHLGYAGRGGGISSFDLTAEETRAAVDYIFQRCDDFGRRGLDHEVLTVGNHTDNAYLYLAVEKRDPARAGELRQLLEWNGGNQSGIAIASINPRGTVHADQFSWDYSLGNVRERPFGEIWADTAHPRMAILKDRTAHLPGRCRACRFVAMCNGNLRARAEFATGDFLGMDPSCYLTDAEIRPSRAV